MQTSWTIWLEKAGSGLFLSLYLSLSPHLGPFQLACLLLSIYISFENLLHIKMSSLMRYWGSEQYGSCHGCSGVSSTTQFCEYCLQLTAASSPEYYLWPIAPAMPPAHIHNLVPKLLSSSSEPVTDRHGGVRRQPLC